MARGETYRHTLAAAAFDTPTALRLRRRYAQGACLMFASALARASGAPVGAFRVPGRGVVGHAFVIADTSPRRDEWIVLDALGRHTLADVRAWYGPTHGPLRWAPRRPLPRDAGDTEPDVAMLAVAGCLPWLHPLVPPAWRVEDRAEARSRVATLLDALERDAAPGWAATERVLAGFRHVVGP